MEPIKINLDENEMPKYWYNITPDLPAEILPPLNPVTKEIIKPSEMEAIFAKELVRQEMSRERYIKIPNDVRDIYRMWRPNPLRRALNFEKMLKTTAKIYYKYEGESPIGSHKTNSSVPQAYYNMKEGIKMLTTETGAGQWGCALAFACQMYGMNCKVFMVRSSFDQKPQRKTMINLWNGDVVASPSMETDTGKKIRNQTPETPGTLGIAISEAIEYALKTPDTKYALGSVLNHVLLHQSVIGLEAKKQLESIEEEPDCLIGCCGGGSNFAGLVFPFVSDIIKNKKNVEIIGAESTSCPTMTKGELRYDLGDSAGKTPYIKMHTLGHDFIPPAHHAGGLRYHGMAPQLSQLIAEGICVPVAYTEKQIFRAGHIFAQAEGIIPAPESAHAIAAVIEKAEEYRKNKENKTIVFNLSGHGFIDMYAYRSYIEGEI